MWLVPDDGGAACGDRPKPPPPLPPRKVSSDRTSMFVGKALTSDRYDRDSSTLEPNPAARLIGRSGSPERNSVDTLTTADRSLPSASTGKLAMIASMLADSTARSRLLPSVRLRNSSFQR